MTFIRVFVRLLASSGVSLSLLGACSGGQAPPTTAAVAPVMSRSDPPSTPSAEPPRVSFGALDIRTTSGGGSLEGQGLELWVDGDKRGVLPATVEGLLAGRRRIEIRDSAGRYDVFSEELRVDAGRTTTLSPRLIVRNGLVTIRAGSGAEGAPLWLRMEGEERRLPVVPIALELRTDTTYEIVARTPGKQERAVPIDFSDGVAIRTLMITLEPK